MWKGPSRVKVVDETRFVCFTTEDVMSNESRAHRAYRAYRSLGRAQKDAQRGQVVGRTKYAV